MITYVIVRIKSPSKNLIENNLVSENNFRLMANTYISVSLAAS